MNNDNYGEDYSVTDGALQTAATLCRQALPISPSATLDFQALDRGFSHDNYRLAVDGDMFFVKIINPSQQRFLPASFAQTAKLQEAAGKLGLAPRLLADNPQVQITRFIPGEHWPLEADNKLLAQLGEKLATLHNIDISDIDLPVMNFVSYWQGYRALIQPAQALFQQHDIASIDNHLDQASQLWHHLELANSAPVACHQDLHQHNVIAHAEQLYFIDWEYSALNSPYMDLAAVAEYFSLGQKQCTEVFSTYQSHRPDFVLDKTLLLAFRYFLRLTECLWWLGQGDGNTTPDTNLYQHALNQLNHLGVLLAR